MTSVNSVPCLMPWSLPSLTKGRGSCMRIRDMMEILFLSRLLPEAIHPESSGKSVDEDARRRTAGGSLRQHTPGSTGSGSSLSGMRNLSKATKRSFISLLPSSAGGKSLLFTDRF